MVATFKDRPFYIASLLSILSSLNVLNVICIGNGWHVYIAKFCSLGK